MKLFKKVLAAALAGVLALSVLTGCSGSGTSTASIVDALNDWAKVNHEEMTFSAGDANLKSKAEAAKDEVEAYTIPDGATGEAVVNELLGKVKTKLALENVTKADDDLYEIGFAEIGQSLNADKSKNVYYAVTAFENSEQLNTATDSIWDTGNKVEVATTTCKVGGKKYLLVLLKSAAVAVGGGGGRES